MINEKIFIKKIHAQKGFRQTRSATWFFVSMWSTTKQEQSCSFLCVIMFN